MMIIWWAGHWQTFAEAALEITLSVRKGTVFNSDVSVTVCGHDVSVPWIVINEIVDGAKNEEIAAEKIAAVLMARVGL